MAFIALAAAAVHAILIAGLALVLLRLGASRRWAVLAAFVAFGAAAVIAAAMLWPLDSCALVNPPGVLAGDWLYAASIQAFGDPNSAQAHYTIPWLLRVPQVYVPASVALYAILGAVAQRLWNRR
jgi:hypothetical protein